MISPYFRKPVFGSTALMLVATLSAVLPSCAKNDAGVGASPSNASVPSALSTPNPIRLNANGWVENESASSDRSVVLTKAEMPREQQEETKKSYKQTELVPIPVGPEYNAQLFKIRNVEEYKDVVFIAPRLFAYGSAQHGHVAPKDNHDGTVSLSLPLALIDGVQGQIVGADDNDKIVVPDTLLVQHYDQLKTELKERFGREQTLATLPGCPKKIELSVNDLEYDVTPIGMKESDYCQINKAFQAPLRVTMDDAKYIFQNALYAGIVQARAEYETLVAFATADLSIEFNKAKVRSELEAELRVMVPPYAEMDVHTKLTNILRNEAMKVHFQGDMTPAIENVVNQAVATFFVPYEPDKNKPTPSCDGKVMACLTLNYQQSKEEENFRFTWQQSTNALTGQIYTTLAKMQPVQDRETAIGTDGRPLLTNSNETGIETGLTVVSGAQIEIKPSFIQVEKRELEQPSTSRQDNNVCVSQHEIMGVHTHCLSHGGECFDTPVPTGRYACDKYENRWVETTTYSMGMPEMEKWNQPAGTVETLYEGLALMFHWASQVDGSQKSVTCPLSVFERVGKGDSIVVTLNNRPGCEVFSADSANHPMISLVNQIHFARKYKTGSYVRRWNGEATDSTVEKTYDPQVNFAGRLGVRGFELMNVFSTPENH